MKSLTKHLIEESMGGKRSRSSMDPNDIERIKYMMLDGYTITEDGTVYAISPESILLVYDEKTYSPEQVADAVKYLERQGIKWKYQTDREALRRNFGSIPVPGSPEE